MRNKLALPALIVVVGLLIMAWLLGLFRTRGHYDDPRKWNASYRHTDDLPLGMALFDSVMAHSLPQGLGGTHHPDVRRRRDIMVV